MKRPASRRVASPNASRCHVYSAISKKSENARKLSAIQEGRSSSGKGEAAAPGSSCVWHEQPRVDRVQQHLVPGSEIDDGRLLRGDGVLTAEIADKITAPPSEALAD